jgi:hypothetical protein
MKYNDSEHKAAAAKLAALFRDIAKTDGASYSNLLRRETVDNMALRAAFEGCPETTKGAEEFLRDVFVKHPSARYQTRAAAADADMMLAKGAANQPTQETDGKLKAKLSKEEVARLDPKTKIAYSNGASVIVPPAPLAPSKSNARRTASGKAEHDDRTSEQIRSQAIAALLKANSKPRK